MKEEEEKQEQQEENTWNKIGKRRKEHEIQRDGVVKNKGKIIQRTKKNINIKIRQGMKPI